ncbi:hypothetical protein Tco_0422053 [Tanacetum coccineum]
MVRPYSTPTCIVSPTNEPWQVATAVAAVRSSRDERVRFISRIKSSSRHEVTIPNPVFRCSEIWGCDSRIIAHAKQKKLNSKQAIKQKLEEHEQRLDVISKFNVADTIKESVQGEKKKRRQKHAGESSSKKEKAPTESTHQETPVDCINDDDAVEHNWFNELADANKDLKEDEIQEGSTIMFEKKLKEILKKDKLSKADLKGIGFKLLKSCYDNNIELEYNMEQIKLAMTTCRRTIPTNYFFNRDLKYLMHRNKEKKYAFSLSKYPATTYDQEGIEEAIPHIWSSTKRVDGEDHVFKEADYLELSLNDFEDMYLLKVQGKLHHLDGELEYDLINSLLLYIRSVVVRKRVEDTQMGVESYQQKLNLTKPLFYVPSIQYKIPYTMMGNPKELYTLTKVTLTCL